jgi:hypothetical protein
LRCGSEARFPKTMALALLKLPLSLLALLVVGLPVLLAVVGLLLVRSRVPHPRQPHHDVAGYIYSGLAVLYAVLLAFVVVIVWQQFNTTDIRVHREADELNDLLRAAQAFPIPVQHAMLEAVRSYARAVIEEEWSDMGRDTENSTAWQAYNNRWQIIRTLEPQSPAEINWHATMIQSLTTLLLLVILILDHPFAGSFRVESEPFVRVLRRVNQAVPQTPEKGL